MKDIVVLLLQDIDLMAMAGGDNRRCHEMYPVPDEVGCPFMAACHGVVDMVGSLGVVVGADRLGGGRLHLLGLGVNPLEEEEEEEHRVQGVEIRVWMVGGVEGGIIRLREGGASLEVVDEVQVVIRGGW